MSANIGENTVCTLGIAPESDAAPRTGRALTPNKTANRTPTATAHEMIRAADGFSMIGSRQELDFQAHRTPADPRRTPSRRFCCVAETGQTLSLGSSVMDAGMQRATWLGSVWSSPMVAQAGAPVDARGANKVRLGAGTSSRVRHCHEPADCCVLTRVLPSLAARPDRSLRSPFRPGNTGTHRLCVRSSRHRGRSPSRRRRSVRPSGVRPTVASSQAPVFRTPLRSERECREPKSRSAWARLRL